MMKTKSNLQVCLSHEIQVLEFTHPMTYLISSLTWLRNNTVKTTQFHAFPISLSSALKSQQKVPPPTYFIQPKICKFTPFTPSPSTSNPSASPVLSIINNIQNGPFFCFSSKQISCISQPYFSPGLAATASWLAFLPPCKYFAIQQNILFNIFFLKCLIW